MFGRPLAIASHHFDTELPSYCDPAIDGTGRLYVANIALFKALAEDPAMAENNAQTFNTPAAKKNGQYFAWDFVMRTAVS